MKINKETKRPEFTDREQQTVDLVLLLVDVGHEDREDAVREALAEHSGRPSKAFVEHLSQGALTMKDGALTAA